MALRQVESLIKALQPLALKALPSAIRTDIELRWCRRSGATKA
jgi:hypothetical protein